MFLKYNSEKTTEKNKEQINRILNLLQLGETLSERIRSYVTECLWVDLHDQIQKNENKKYMEQLDQLIIDFVNLIDNQEKSSSGLKPPSAVALKQKKTVSEQLHNVHWTNEKISSYLKILFHGEQRNTLSFAQRIAEELKAPLKFASEFLNCIEKYKEDKGFNLTFLAGFIAGLNKIDSKKILDKIAKDSSLVDFLIPSYYYIKLQDRDITRLINIIDKINLKSADLRTLAIGRKCKSVSSEIMGKLIQTLSRRGIRFSWDALQIYNYYEYRDKSEQKNKLIPVLYDLLTQDKFLSDKEKYDTMDGHYYEKAVNDLLDSDYGKDFSKKFISQIIAIKTSVFDLPISSETIRKCLSKIIGEYPDMILPTITNNIDDFNIDFLFRTESINRHQISPLACLSIEQIKAWCEINSDKIPAFLAKNMPLFNGQSWSPFAMFLLDNYGDKTSVTDALSMNLGQFSWTGRLSDYFKQTALLHIKNIDLRETNKFQDKSSGFQIVELFMPSP